MTSVQGIGVSNISAPTVKAPEVKDNKEKAKKIALVTGTVLASAAACAGIIYAVKTGRANKVLKGELGNVNKTTEVLKNELTSTKKTNEALKNIIKNKNLRATKATVPSKGNIIKGGRDLAAKKEYLANKGTFKQTKLMNNLFKEIDLVEDTSKIVENKKLTGMLKQYSKEAGLKTTNVDELFESAKFGFEKYKKIANQTSAQFFQENDKILNGLDATKLFNMLH